MIWRHIFSHTHTHTHKTLTQTDLIGLFLLQEMEGEGLFGGCGVGILSFLVPHLLIPLSWTGVSFSHHPSFSLLMSLRWIGQARVGVEQRGGWYSSLYAHIHDVHSDQINILPRSYCTLVLRIWESKAARSIMGYHAVNIWSTAPEYRNHFDPKGIKLPSPWFHKHPSSEAICTLMWNRFETSFSLHLASHLL